MSRQDLIHEIEQALAGRALVYFGTRGDDARPLMSLPGFQDCISITAALAASSLDPERNVSLEQLTGRRVDLDVYDIDEDAGPAVAAIEAKLEMAMQRPNVTVPYRPCARLTNVHYATFDVTQMAGLVKDDHLRFEHKPWVETLLRRDAGIPTIKWEYVRSESAARIIGAFTDGPIVVRRSRGAGGVGMTLVAQSSDAEPAVRAMHDPILAIAPFYDHATSFNVGACAYPGGHVSVHPASIQLVGIPGFTSRTFGYCGNDFAAMADVPSSLVAEIQDLTERTGRWLVSRGYIGAFGLDLLWTGTELLFVELNPRFQGSTWVSNLMARQLDVPELLLEHLAAHLGIEPPAPRSLRWWIEAAAPMTNVVLHKLDGATPEAITGPLETASIVARELEPSPEVEVDIGACSERLAIRGSLLDLGLGSGSLNDLQIGGS